MAVPQAALVLWATHMGLQLEGEASNTCVARYGVVLLVEAVLLSIGLGTFAGCRLGLAPP